MTLPSLAPRHRAAAPVLALLMTVAVAAACRSDSVTSAKDGTVTRLNEADPARDTLANTDDTLDRGLDLRQTTVRTKRDTVVFVLRFTGPVQSPAAGAATSLYGYIDIDTDQDHATGGAAASDSYGGDSQLGVDYFVDLFDADQTLAPVAIINADGTLDLAGYATVMYDADSLMVRVPTAALGDDEGNFDFTLTLGTVDRPSDIAPNSGSYKIAGSGAAMVAARASVAHAAAVRGTAARGTLASVLSGHDGWTRRQR